MYQRINNRVDHMMKAGLINEVEQLLRQGFTNCQSMQAIGYKELIPAIDQDISIEQAVDKLKQHSRNYAKRQMTWFKNKMNVQWFDREQQPLPLILDDITAHINKKKGENAIMNDKSIQENFLQGFKDSKEELTVFLLNGFQMKGTIVEFDDTVVNLFSQGKNHLIYKHAISTFTQEPSVVE